MLMVAGCANSSPEAAGAPTAHITADGSSTVFPLTKAVSAEFQQLHPAVKVSVAVSGTGNGFDKFCRGEIDIQSASRPIDATEKAACDKKNIAFLEVPVAFDALTIIVHPSNHWATSMTIAELRKVWEPAAHGRVMRWADVRAGWPNQPIHLFGPGTASGTFDFFTEVVAGTTGASRTDYTASEDDGVIVRGVAADPHALGYVGYGHFAQSGASLKAVAIDSQSGSEPRGPVVPETDTVRRGLYHPLSRALFIYVNAKSAERKAVGDFVTFYLTQDEALIDRVGGIPLSSRAYELIRERVTRRAPGTLFADRAVLQRNIEMVLAESKQQ